MSETCLWNTTVLKKSNLNLKKQQQLNRAVTIANVFQRGDSNKRFKIGFGEEIDVKEIQIRTLYGALCYLDKCFLIVPLRIYGFFSWIIQDKYKIPYFAMPDGYHGMHWNKTS